MILIKMTILRGAFYQFEAIMSVLCSWFYKCSVELLTETKTSGSILEMG